MRRNKTYSLLAAVALGIGCVCFFPSAGYSQYIESCSEADADLLLKVVWTIPSIQLSETNTLGFKKTGTEENVFRSRTSCGMMTDWHGAGQLRWSLSPLCSTNGVELTLNCRWKDAEGSGETNTTIFVPRKDDLTGVTNEIVKSVKWITDKSPDRAGQTVGLEAAPRSDR